MSDIFTTIITDKLITEAMAGVDKSEVIDAIQKAVIAFLKSKEFKEVMFDQMMDSDLGYKLSDKIAGKLVKALDKVTINVSFGD